MIMVQVIEEEMPDTEEANRIYDELVNKMGWMKALSTVAYLLALVHSGGDRSRPKKIEIFVVEEKEEWK